MIKVKCSHKEKYFNESDCTLITIYEYKPATANELKREGISASVAKVRKEYVHTPVLNQECDNGFDNVWTYIEELDGYMNITNYQELQDTIDTMHELKWSLGH
jgi:hypothetical protein